MNVAAGLALTAAVSGAFLPGPVTSPIG